MSDESLFREVDEEVRAERFQKLWKQYQRIVKDNGAIVLFAKPPFDKILAHSNIDNYRYDWVWEKTRATGHLNARRMPMQAHENVCVFYAKQPLYIPQMSTGHKPMNNYYSSHLGECYGKSSVMAGGGSTERFPRSVLKYPPVPNKDRLHPNQKPVALLEFFIKTYTKEGAEHGAARDSAVASHGGRSRRVFGTGHHFRHLVQRRGHRRQD